jgi:AraC-like DNA-binding protein
VPIRGASEQARSAGCHRPESLSPVAGKFNGSNAYGVFRRHTCSPGGRGARLPVYRASGPASCTGRPADQSETAFTRRSSFLALLRAALHHDGRCEKPNAATTARLIRRAKEFLEAQSSDRILLAVGPAVGTSPAYLTNLFTRTEGVSLHQYLTQLRLARALVELPHADDLTRLALDVGFSSHGHLSYAFRLAFGCTPSQFREATRSAASPSAFQMQ